MSSDIEFVVASQDPPPATASTSTHSRASLVAMRAQAIILDASSDAEPDNTLPSLPDMASLAASQSQSQVPARSDKGKKRALDPPESSAALSQEILAHPSPSKRRTSTASDGFTKTRKPRLGADGLTAAERRKIKAAETEAKKQFKRDNKKMVGRKAALSEIVIIASEGCKKSRHLKSALEGLIEDIKLSEDEDAAMITYQRVSNKYLDPVTGQFRRYADKKLHCTPDKHVIYLLHTSDLDSLVGRDAFHTQIQDIKRAVGCPLKSAQDPEWKFILLVQGLSVYARSEKQESRRLCSHAQLDEALTRLTVLERVFVIRSESSKDTQRWLFELSIDVAYRPYKILDRAPIESLGIDGTSKGKANASGSEKGLKTTYVSMLSSMHQITDGQAESIAKAYPTFQLLLSAFEERATQKDKERLLVGLPMIRNKDGAQTSREIGKDTSKRVYLQLFGKDPHLSMQTMKGL